MSYDLINTIILSASFLLLFGLAELFFHKLSVKVELTRKLVHFGTGLLTLLFPILLSNHWYVLFLCTSFLIILILSLKFNLLKSINQIDRQSFGSILYPISVYILFIFYDYQNELIYFYLPVLVLAICDPIAALVGKTWPIGKYKLFKETKTIMGSSAFLFSAIIINMLLFYYFGFIISGQLILLTCIISLIATMVEAISQKGFDNLFIPVIVGIVMLVFEKNNLWLP